MERIREVVPGERQDVRPVLLRPDVGRVQVQDGVAARSG